MPQQQIIIPMKLKSHGNDGRHWSKKRKDHNFEKNVLRLYLNKYIEPKLPCKVTFIRLAPRPFDEDNLVYAFKWQKDEIADFFIPGLKRGQADSDPRMTWHYEQRSIGVKKYGVQIIFDHEEL